MPFTLLFTLVALLILFGVFGLVLAKKGWIAAVLAGGITFVVLVVAFAVTLFVIVNAMNGTPG